MSRNAICVGYNTVILQNAFHTTISGPATVCSSGCTFSVSNLPSTVTSIIWEPGPYLTVYSGQNTNSPLIKATGIGSSWVSVRLVTACGEITLPQKTVWRGSPVLLTTIIPFYQNGMEFGNDSYYNFRVTPHLSASYYNWDVDGGTIIEGQGTSWITVKTQRITGNSNVNFSVGVRMENTCGESIWFVRTGWVVSGTGPAWRSISFFPNPSTGETTLSIEQGSTEEATLKSAFAETTFDETAEWDLEVYDSMQHLKLKKQKQKGSSATINTQSWKEGIYMVRVKYKDEMLTGKLVVKK
ncbi:MAG: T9SS type A sorting domain-containing protein [Draconibacterium sp.]